MSNSTGWVVMRKRVTEEESGKFVLKAEDYTIALKAEFAANSSVLKDLGLDAAKDAGKAEELGKRLLAGRELFFGKARCANCHTGDTFTDHTFHNLGVGATKIAYPGTERLCRLALPRKPAGSCHCRGEREITRLIFRAARRRMCERFFNAVHFFAYQVK